MRSSALFWVLGTLLRVTSASAQTGGGYDLTWNTVDGGGASFSTGGGFTLGATIGQPDAGTLSGGAYILAGGFWTQISPAIVPSPTPTRATTPTGTLPATSTPTSTATLTGPPTASPSVPPASTATPTTSVSNTAKPTVTRSPTPPITASPTSSPTLPRTCVGDCNSDGSVTVDELLTMVTIALGDAGVDTCSAGDANHDRRITIDEILTSVNNALNRCGPPSR